MQQLNNKPCYTLIGRRLFVSTTLRAPPPLKCKQPACGGSIRLTSPNLLLLSRAKTTSTTHSHTTTGTGKMSDAQRAAYEYYRRQREDTLWYKLFGNRGNSRSSSKRSTPVSQAERNVAVAWYAAAIVVGALRATYSAVPLYTVFCQTTGFGGTTQCMCIVDGKEVQPSIVRSLLQSVAAQIPITTARVHSWTNEELAAKLASLKPVANVDLITVNFDMTVSDILPWRLCTCS